jgi:hypothetical protein
MGKKTKIFLYSLLGIFLLMQIYPSKRPETTDINKDDLLKNEDVPKNISSMLRSACYDCHSNETIYPWYASVAPLKWWVYDHIEEGREELNFSEWNSWNKGDKAEALDDIATEVMDNKMPLESYPITHPKAKLSEADRQAISDWAEMLSEKLFE